MMTGATSPQATTSTPESSEAPRENRVGLGLTEEQLMLQDAVATGTGFMVDGKRVDPQDVRLATAKVSSPELASLAAKYVKMSDKTAHEKLVYDDGYLSANALVPFMDDVRALAASVLAQAEGTPRK
jgi:hypothetical protein